MNLKKFQQSELKRFDKKFEGEICCGGDFCDYEDHSKIPNKIKDFLKSSIEKAYALGKEEKGKEILAEIDKYKKKLKKWYFLKDTNKEQCGLCMEDDYCSHEIKVEAIDEVINLLKNK